MIGRLIDCDVHRIEAADPYPDAYAATVERNVREQDSNARPAIANPLDSIERYDTVLLGSPIWNVRAPMIMSVTRSRKVAESVPAAPLSPGARAAIRPISSRIRPSRRSLRVGHEGDAAEAGSKVEDGPEGGCA
jgi:hypothetical protein